MFCKYFSLLFDNTLCVHNVFWLSSSLLPLFSSSSLHTHTCTCMFICAGVWRLEDVKCPVLSLSALLTLMQSLALNLELGQLLAIPVILLYPCPNPLLARHLSDSICIFVSSLYMVLRIRTQISCFCSKQLYPWSCLLSFQYQVSCCYISYHPLVLSLLMFCSVLIMFTHQLYWDIVYIQ